VQAVANLWIDYMLLATAAAQDSTLGTSNLDAIVQPYFNQQLVFKLRDEVIQVDTVIPDEELRRCSSRSSRAAKCARGTSCSGSRRTRRRRCGPS
jgi:hypothetical protein